MVQCSPPALDLSFAALSDGTRRGIIDHLGRADASITSLADKFQMTLTGMKKHVQVLERAGLVVTQKVGRVRTCRLGERGLTAEAEWIEAHRKLFEARFEALDEIISEIEQEKRDGSASSRRRR
jgi:DNA-binding transcriptional ArsR family regulator